MRRPGAVWACLLLVGALGLAAQARAQDSPGELAQTPPQGPAPASDFAGLSGWAEEDHLAALNAFRAGCGAGKDPVRARVCQLAKALANADETTARQFFETHFRLAPVDGEGVLTAYYAPVFDARRSRQGPFTAPVRPRPAGVRSGGGQDPIGALALASNTAGQALDDDPIGAALAAADAETRAAAGPPPAGALSRAEINAQASDDALAWMRPEDLFFLQIQGSGVLVFDDGDRRKALYAGDNGLPFVGIARPMARQGLLRPDNVSGGSIQHWLADHAGPEAEAVMNLNPRYVYFRLAPADGGEPAGAAGAPLPPGRAIAVDPAYHAYGELIWIDAATPSLAGAQARYRRLALALDTGGAIKGRVRADLYMGSGPDAGAEAGRVRHTLHMVELAPRDETAAAAGLRGPGGR